jgi:hypothetical protein
MMLLAIVISTAWTVTCLVAARQVKWAMSRKRATLRLGELMSLGEHWICLDPDKRVLGPMWMN